MNRFILLSLLLVMCSSVVFAQEERVSQGLQTNTTTTTYNTVTYTKQVRMTKEEWQELKRAKKAEQKAAKEEIARIKAEEKAKLAAEREEAYLRALEKKEIAREAARIKAEEDRRLADEAARIRAEEMTKLAAEKAEKRRVEQEKKLAERAIAKDLKKTRIEEYNALYDNNGLINSFQVSYSPQFEECDIIYTNLGYQKYTNLNPIEIDYLCGYRFNNFCAVNLGVGFMWNLSNLNKVDDTIYIKYERPKYRNFDIPIFANLGLYLLRSKIQPIVSISIGVYSVSGRLLSEAGAGVNIRINKQNNVHLIISAKTTPWPDFSQTTFTYSTVITPSFKLGFTF